MRNLLVIALVLAAAISQAKPEAKKIPRGALFMTVAPAWKSVDGGAGCREDVGLYEKVCDVVYTRANGDAGEIDVLVSPAGNGETPLSVAQQRAGVAAQVIETKPNVEATFEWRSWSGSNIINVVVVRRIKSMRGVFVTFEAMWPDSIDAEARKHLRAMVDTVTLQTVK